LLDPLLVKTSLHHIDIDIQHSRSTSFGFLVDLNRYHSNPLYHTFKMRATIRSLAALASAAALIAPAIAQTYTNCNPTLRSDCPPDSALGRTVNIDLTSASDSFTPQGNPSYSKDGVTFTVAKSGDSPQLTSKWYIMFGRVEFVMKAAPGAGIVSSFVLQSDDLDEIDWEWLGADANQVQR
jgi:hypothetical protein